MITAAQAGYLAFGYNISDIFARLAPKTAYNSRAKARARKTPDFPNPIEEGAIDTEDQVIIKDFIRQGGLEAYAILTPLTQGISGLFAAPNGVLASAGLGVGTTPAEVASIAFPFYIGAISYEKAAIPAGTSPGTDVVPTGLYGAVAFDIDATGAITVAVAPNNSAGYLTAAAAIAALPACEGTKARMGTLSAMNAAAAFTFGTTALNAANTTVAFNSLNFIATGLSGFLFDNPVFAPNKLLITINQKEWMVDDMAVKLNELISDVFSEYTLAEWFKINELYDDVKLHEMQFQKALVDLNTTSHMRKKVILTTMPQP